MLNDFCSVGLLDGGRRETGGTLHLAFTPYHALLATAVACGQGSGRDVLAIVGDFDSTPIAQCLLAWESSPFRAVHLLPGLHQLQGTARVRLRQRRTTVLVGALVSCMAPERVLVCNDSRPEGQRALHAASLADADTGCIEDGSAAYASTVRQWRLHEWIGGKVVFGRWWSPVRVHGRSPWSREIHALFPDLVRDELTELRVHAVPVAPLRAFAESAAFLQYLDRTTAAASDTEVDVLCCLAHSDFLTDLPAYRAGLCQVIQALERGGALVAVKYHPRESQPGYLGEPVSRARTLPNALPLEALFLRHGRSIRAVVGDISTALISARWLLDPAVDVISMTEATGFRNGRLMDVFRRLGVALARGPEDVVRLIDPARRTSSSP